MRAKSKHDDPTWQRAFGHLKKTKKGPSERTIHKQVVQYIQHQYPQVRFVSTLLGENMPPHQREAMMSLQWGPGVPDLLIIWKGLLALEIKRDEKAAFNESGTLKRTVHLKRQAAWLSYFREQGFHAAFGNGLDHCISIIDNFIRE